EGAIEVFAKELVVRRAQQAEDDPLALALRPGRLFAKLADARAGGLGGVELLEDRLAPGAVAVGLFDPLFQIVDGLRQLGVLPLPDGHRLLVVLVGRPAPMFLALRACQSQVALPP